ncbi:chitobiase/beta-hexosaminidase C-terminal domain-containing protein [candidate division KSB1 bacterium]
MRINKTTLSCIIIVLSIILTGSFHCSSDNSGWKPAASNLTTQWTKKVSPKNVLKEYPRPQMIRDEWRNLNGLWDFAVTDTSEGIPEIFNEKILVPFSVESSLSGIGRRVDETNRLWYRKLFEIPSKWKNKRILLHFGAVDWETVVYVNGKNAGEHRGGYDPFSVDITEFCLPDSEQELIISVWDPTTEGEQPRGKQTLRPRGIYYTPSSGIWQTVWLEPVEETYIQRIRTIPDIDRSTLVLQVETNSDEENIGIKAEVFEGGKNIAATTGTTGEDIIITIPDAKWWSPDSPFLYDLHITMTATEKNIEDHVESYFGLRKIEIRSDEKNITRLFLNNKFIFQLGPLDQGFWPDGLYTAPTDDALLFDIEFMKDMGFNMVRKHVKVEPSRWYYWCDKLGLLVWQDMPNGRSRTDEGKEQFERELENVVTNFYNHPSIIMWVPFNEGWGQYDTERIVQNIKEIDPSRLVDNASGWTDRETGDVIDIHSYPNPRSPIPEPDRAAVLGEFGGLGFNVADHAWNSEGWGYALLETQSDLITTYEDLYKNLLPLIDSPGLSAAVYTQITDIESENNGLMTYDREIIKIPVETAKLAHNGYLPPEKTGKADIYIDKTDVTLICSKTGAEIWYTTDGREPGQNSNRYTGPISITENTTIKTKATWENGISSRVRTIEMTKVEPKKPASLTDLSGGLNLSYYEGRWEALPDFSQLSATSVKKALKFDLSSAERENEFALKFEGYLDIPVTGVYTLYVSSDDGTRFFLGDQMLIDNDGIHGMRENHYIIALEKGKHPLTLLYFQGSRGKGLLVSYEGPGIEKQEIPPNILYHLNKEQ